MLNGAKHSQEVLGCFDSNDQTNHFLKYTTHHTIIPFELPNNATLQDGNNSVATKTIMLFSLLVSLMKLIILAKNIL